MSHLGYSLVQTAGQVVSPSSCAPHHLAELRGAHLGQGLHLAHLGVVVTERQTWRGEMRTELPTVRLRLTVRTDAGVDAALSLVVGMF